MTFPEVGIRGVADMASFAAGMDLYNSSIDEMIDASQRAATEAGGALNRFVDRATEGAMEAAVVFGGLGATIAAFATKSAFSAARIEELEIVLALVARTAGYASETVDGMVMALEDQGIAATAAREGVLRVMQAQLDLGAALELAKAAQDLAIVGQRESTATFQDFIKATVTGNTIILRKYGIMSTGIMMYKELAKKLGITTKELTQTQKQEAIMTGILQAALPVQGAYNEAMTTASKNFRSLPRLIEDVVIAFGEGFLPVFKEVIFAAKELLKSLGNLDRQTWDTISQIAGLAAVMASAVGSAGGLVFTLPKLATALTFLTGPLGVVAAAVGALAYAFVIDFGGIRDIVAPVVETVQELLGLLVDRLTQLPSSLQGTAMLLGEIVADVSAFAGGLAESVQEVATAFEAGGLLQVVEMLGIDLHSVVEQVFGAEITDLIGGFVDDIGDRLADIQDAFETRGLVGAIEELGENLYDALEEVFGKGIASLVADFVRNIERGLSDIKDAFEARGVLGAIEEFGEQVYGVIERVFGKGVADMVADFVRDVERGLTDIRDAFKAGGVTAAIEEFGRQVYGVIERVFGARVADMVATFVGDVQRGLSDIVNAFRAEGVVGAIEELGKQVFDVVEKVFGPTVAETISEFAENTRDFLEDVQDAFEEGGIVGAVEEAGYQLYDAIAEAFGTETADLIADFVENSRRFLQDVVDAFEEGGLPAAAETIGEELYRAIEDAFSTETADIIAGFAENTREFIEDVVGAFQDTGLEGAIGEFQEQLRTSLKKMDWEKLKFYGGEIVSNILEGMAIKIEFYAPQLAFYAGQIVKNVLDKIELYWPDLKFYGGEIVKNLIDGFAIETERKREVLFFYVGQIVKNLWEGLLRQVDELKFYGGEIISNIIEGIRIQIDAKIEELRGIGQDIIDGLKAGMEAKLEELHTFVVDLANLIPDWVRRAIGAESPAQAFIDIALDMVRGLLVGWEEGFAEYEPQFVSAVAEAVQQVASALQVAVGAFGAITGYEGGMRGVIDTLVADVEYVLTAVRERLLDLWGWAGAREDTVWGHMEDWADAVEGVVGVVADAAEAFTALKDYQGVLPAAIEAFVADIKTLLEALGTIKREAVDEALVEWAELAGDLLSALSSIVKDLETLAGFEGGLRIASEKIQNLMDALDDAVGAIVYAYHVTPAEPVSEAYQALIDEIETWISENGRLVSALAGLIKNLETLTAFEGGLELESGAVLNLIDVLDDAVGAIVFAYHATAAVPVHEAYQALILEVEKWIIENGKLVSGLSALISNLETLAAFEGGLELTAGAVLNLIDTLDEAAGAIISAYHITAAVPVHEGYQAVIDEVEKWIIENGKLVSAIAALISELEALAAFEGGLKIETQNIQNVIDALDSASGLLIGAYYQTTAAPITDAYQAVINAVEKWIIENGKLVSAIAVLIEDLEALAAFEGGLNISETHIQNIIDALDSASGLLIGAYYQTTAAPITDAYQAVIDAVEKWIVENGKLISGIAALMDDLETLAAFEGGLSITVDNVQNIIDALDSASGLLIGAYYQTTAAPITEAYQSVINAVESWIVENGKLVSAITSLIEDLGTLAAFQGGLDISVVHIQNVIDALDDASGLIIGAYYQTTAAPITDAYQFVIDTVEKWITENGKLVSALTSLIDDLEELAAFEGGLEISTSNVQNVMDALDDASGFITDAYYEIAAVPIDDASQAVVDMVERWIVENGRLVSALASLLDDLETLVAFEGELIVNVETVKSIITALGDAVDKILEEIGGLEDFDEDAMAAAKTFSETAGAVAEMLAKGLEAFIGLENFVAPSDIAMQNFANAIVSLVKKFELAAGKFDADMLAHTEIFASAAGEVISLIADALEAFDALKGYGRVAVIRFENLRKDIEAAVKMLDDISEDTKKAVPDAAAFAVASKEIFDFIKEAVDALGDLSKYENVTSWKFRRLQEDIEDAIQVLADLAVSVDQQMLDDAWDFSQTVGVALGYVVDALVILASIGEYTGVGAVWATIKSDIEDVFDELGIVTGIVIEHEPEATAFKTAMDNVMGDVADGFDILNSLDVVLPDWPTSDLQASLDELADLGAAAVTEFAQGISEAASSVSLSEAFNDLVDEIEHGALDVWQTLKGTTYTWGLVDYGERAVLEFCAGIRDAADSCVGDSFAYLAQIVADGVAEVNAALDNLGVSSPRFHALHMLNAELMQTAAIAAATLQTIAFAAEPRPMIPLGAGGGTTYNQTFHVSPTVSGNTFMIREEADIGRVTEATLEAMREGLGDITSRRERY